MDSLAALLLLKKQENTSCCQSKLHIFQFFSRKQYARVLLHTHVENSKYVCFCCWVAREPKRLKDLGITSGLATTWMIWTPRRLFHQTWDFVLTLDTPTISCIKKQVH